MVYVAGDTLEQLLRQLKGLTVKDHQVYLHLMLQKELAEGRNGYLQGFILGKSVVARRNQRKSDRLAVMLQCQLQRVIVAITKQRFFAIATTIPNWAHCVDQMLGIQVKSRRNGRSSAGDTADFLPCLQQLGTGLFVDHGIRSEADYRLRIGSIHNGIHLHIGDIISNNCKRHTHRLLFVILAHSLPYV